MVIRLEQDREDSNSTMARGVLGIGVDRGKVGQNRRNKEGQREEERAGMPGMKPPPVVQECIRALSDIQGEEGDRHEETLKLSSDLEPIISETGETADSSPH